jgi:RNA polymerase I-specific transcription initiation factor RRN7
MTYETVETILTICTAPLELLKMFPIDRPATSTAPAEHVSTADNEELIQRRTQAFQTTLQQAMIVTDEEAEEYENAILRPGMAYKHYRTESDLPPAAKAFYEVAARVVGLSFSALIGAVFKTEAKLESWKREKRRKEKGVGMSVEEFEEFEVGDGEGGGDEMDEG